MEMVGRGVADVLIIDKAFGVQPVLDFIGKIRDLRSNAAVVVWAAAITEAEALRYLQHGARGILRKTADMDKVLVCIRSVGNGTTWMEDTVFREAARQDASHPRSDLTHRERQVMELVEQGLKNKDIARELGIRPGTVKIHLKHIFEKTGVRGRYGLALSGLRHRGVISMMTV
jgi:DNA-binding NarL/FixJ family response regulator